MKKTVQYLKMEIEIINRNGWNHGDEKNLSNWTWKHQQQNARDGKKRISGVEDMAEKIVPLVKEKVKLKNLQTQNYVKTKHKNNSHKRRWKPIKNPREYIQQNHRRNIFQPKIEHAYKGKRSLQNT